jgi:oligopeptide/dipeptide ABC transporter ATP-binding protein
MNLPDTPEADRPDVLLQVNDLRVEIPRRSGAVRAVDNVSFEVPRGQAMGLVGESGSGKSMTLRAILGVLPSGAQITSGNVIFDGQDISGRPANLRRVRGKKISMIFQEPMTALNPVVRVGDQIAEGPIVNLGYHKAAAAERAIELMTMVGIPDPRARYRAYPHELSGGLRQRIMIAIALACDPELILCDEPTTALDVTIQDQILKILTRLCSDRGVSLLFVTHDLAVVAQTCQSVAVMYAGRIVETGTVERVFREPRHAYTLGLLRSAPDFDNVQAKLVPIPGAPPSLTSRAPGCAFRPRCSFAQDDCAQDPVPLLVVESGHYSACFHHDECAASARLDPVIR